MTTKEIAKRLNECANRDHCPYCKHRWERDCESRMVKDMGAEIRKNEQKEAEE